MEAQAIHWMTVVGKEVWKEKHQNKEKEAHHRFTGAAHHASVDTGNTVVCIHGFSRGTPSPKELWLWFVLPFLECYSVFF